MARSNKLIDKKFIKNYVKNSLDYLSKLYFLYIKNAYLIRILLLFNKQNVALFQ